MRHELGVYLLGALAPADRIAVDTHLASCAGCRGELADMAGLPALLRMIPVADAESLVSAGSVDGGSVLPYRPLESLLRRVAKRRRSRTWAGLAAVAAGLAAFAAAADYALETPSQQHSSLALAGAVTVRATNPLDDVSATVRYAGRPWGIQLDVQVNGIPAGTRCVFEVTDTSGQESQAASWTVVAGEKDAWYLASSSVPVMDVREFVVTAGAQALVRVSVPRGRRSADKSSR